MYFNVKLIRLLRHWRCWNIWSEKREHWNQQPPPSLPSSSPLRVCAPWTRWILFGGSVTWSLRVFSGEPGGARGTDAEAETDPHTGPRTATPGGRHGKYTVLHDDSAHSSSPSSSAAAASFDHVINVSFICIKMIRRWITTLFSRNNWRMWRISASNYYIILSISTNRTILQLWQLPSAGQVAAGSVFYFLFVYLFIGENEKYFWNLKSVKLSPSPWQPS